MHGLRRSFPSWFAFKLAGGPKGVGEIVDFGRTAYPFHFSLFFGVSIRSCLSASNKSGGTLNSSKVCFKVVLTPKSIRRQCSIGL